MAAGDQRDEGNEKSHKKPDSPHGWEEGKDQGTPILLLQGSLNFNKSPHNHFDGILSVQMFFLTAFQNHFHF